MGRNNMIVIAALLVIAASNVNADFCNKTVYPACGSGGQGKELAVIDMNNFCLFLPPVAGEQVNIAEGCCGSSWCTRRPDGCAPISTDAVVFCTNTTIAPGSLQMPPNFIRSAHFVKSADGNTVQITGLLNNVWLDPSDFGGQFDFTGIRQWMVNSPPAGMMQDYAEYVQLVGNGVFCIQGCRSQNPGCNSDNDYSGCLIAIPGDYGSGFDIGVVPALPRQNSPESNQDQTSHSSLVPPPIYVKTPVPAPPGQGGLIPFTTTQSTTTATATTATTTFGAPMTTSTSLGSSTSGAGKMKNGIDYAGTIVVVVCIFHFGVVIM